MHASWSRSLSEAMLRSFLRRGPADVATTTGACRGISRDSWSWCPLHAAGSHLVHGVADRGEVFEVDAVGEIPHGGDGAAVSELRLHEAEVFGGFPHIFGGGASEIVDVEFAANSQLRFEFVEGLCESRVGAGWVSLLLLGAQQGDDGRARISAVVDESFDGVRNFAGCGQRLMGVALGGKAEAAAGAIVIRERDARGGAMP